MHKHDKGWRQMCVRAGRILNSEAKDVGLCRWFNKLRVNVTTMCIDSSIHKLMFFSFGVFTSRGQNSIKSRFPLCICIFPVCYNLTRRPPLLCVWGLWPPCPFWFAAGGIVLSLVRNHHQTLRLQYAYAYIYAHVCTLYVDWVIC